MKTLMYFCTYQEAASLKVRLGCFTCICFFCICFSYMEWVFYGNNKKCGHCVCSSNFALISPKSHISNTNKNMSDLKNNFNFLRKCQQNHNYRMKTNNNKSKYLPIQRHVLFKVKYYAIDYFVNLKSKFCSL